MNTNVYRGGGNESTSVFFNSGVLFCFSGVSVDVVVVYLVLSCLFGLGSWFFREPQFSFVSTCCRVSPQGCVTISWNRKYLTLIPSRLHPVTSLSDSYLVALSLPQCPTTSFFKFLSPLSPVCILTVASPPPVPVSCIWAGFPASHQVNSAHDHFLIFIEAVLPLRKFQGIPPLARSSLIDTSPLIISPLFLRLASLLSTGWSIQSQRLLKRKVEETLLQGVSGMGLHEMLMVVTKTQISALIGHFVICKWPWEASVIVAGGEQLVPHSLTRVKESGIWAGSPCELCSPFVSTGSPAR